jgi:hypothetical protein
MSNDKQTKIDSLLGRALRDKEFRQRLIDNPAEAAADADLSPDELDMVAGGFVLPDRTALRPISFMDRINPIAYCTEKTCNEKGSARVLTDILSNPGLVTRLR